MRKIAIVKGVHDPEIKDFCTTGDQIGAYTVKNAALLTRYREGDSGAKLKMYGLIVGEYIDGKPKRRLDSSFRQGYGVMADIDVPLPFSLVQTAEYIVRTLADVNMRDYCYLEASASAGVHGILPDVCGDAKRSLQLYQQLLPEVKLDMCVTNPSRICLLTGIKLGGTSLDNLFKEIPQSLFEGVRAMAGLQPSNVVEVEQENSVPSVVEDVKASSDIELYREIIAELLGGQMPERGTRNQTLYRHTVELMSLGVTDNEQLCDVFESFDWYGLSSSEGKLCIRSAMKKEAPERSAEMREAVTAVLEKLPHTTVQISNDTVITMPVSDEASHIVPPSATDTDSASTPAGWTPWGVLPPMPAKMPSVIRHVVSPIRAQHTWAHALTLSESALATYLKNVTFTELTGLSKPLYNGWFAVSLAPSSSGKSVATTCIKAITKKLDEEDREIRAKLQEWVDEERTRKSSDGVRKPKNTSRLCGSDTTSSGLFQRFKELEPGTALYISTPELLSLKNVASGDYVKFFLMAHDAEEYSVERSTSTGESGRALLSLNCSAMAPISIGQEFFAGHTEDGLVSRFIFATIEENKNWDDLEPLYDTTKLKNYADGFEKYIQRLEAAEGKHFAKREIEDFCKGLQEEIFQMAAEYNSESLRILSRRAIIHLQKMCYLYMILEGRWTADLQDFMLWRWRYMLGAMYRVMGKNIESEISKSTSLLNACKSQSGPISILASMPEHFTFQEFMARRKSLSFADQSEGAAKAQLRTLKFRGLVQPDDTGYINLKKKKP